MSTDVETVPADQLQAAEAADAKSEADLMADVDKALGDRKKQADSAGDETNPPGDAKETVQDGDEPKPLDASMLAHAKAVGLDKETAERFHKAGLLEEALVTADRRKLAESISGRQEGTQRPQQQAKPDENAGQQVQGTPPPLSEEEYPEELVARDRYMQGQIAAQAEQLASLQQQLQQVGPLVQDFQTARDKARDDWFDAKLGEIGNEELFGKGPLDALPADSPQKANRIQAFRAYAQLTGSPYGMDATGVQRAVRALFHDDIKRADQRKLKDRLRDAAGRLLSPTTGGKAPPKNASSPEEDEADLMAEVDKALARHGK